MSSPTEKNLKRAEEIMANYHDVIEDNEIIAELTGLIAHLMNEAEPQWPSELESTAAFLAFYSDDCTDEDGEFFEPKPQQTWDACFCWLKGKLRNGI